MTCLRALLLCVLSVFLGVAVAQTDDSLQDGQLPLNELRTFVEVLERIRTAYVEPVDDATLLENAIRGMLEGLDPHSAYLEPEAFRGLQDSTSGQFGGLGIEVGQEDGFIKVISPIDDTPAARAGIEAGDLIIKLDEQPTKGISLMDAVNKMRGEVGSSITLTIVRDDGRPFEVELTRAVIRVQSVRSQMLEEGYAYLRITQFQNNTADDVRNKLKELKAGELRGLVLDLRNNPGGVLQAAVGVADSFLPGGNVVYTEGRLSNAEMRFNATSHNPSGEVPVVVLINGGSASAAEIVAGALQDHGRAVVMGTDSFGKGSVQTVLPLNNDRGLKLTTAIYFTPNGRSIQAQGIVPDIRVERARLTREEDEIGAVRESDLQGHLRRSETSTPVAAEERERPQDSDYQLNQALTLLKGLHITRKKP